MNRKNLAKLATYLESLPDDYEAFDMSSFFDSTDHEAEISYALHNGGVHNCGTSACAVGHGPAAGFLLNPDEIGWFGPRWSEYSARVFTYPHTPEWDWMFSGAWCEVDNTIKGAAARIRYLLAGNLVPIPLTDCEWTDEHVALYS